MDCASFDRSNVRGFAQKYLPAGCSVDLCVLCVSWKNEPEPSDFGTDEFILLSRALGWDCLTIGALGWGQIRIANSNIITINEKYSRKWWMLEFCDIMLEFYPKEIGKIGNQIERFKQIQSFWKAHPDE